MEPDAIPGFVKWLNRVLAPWAGFQGTLCILLGAAILLFGMDTGRGPGTPVFVGMILVALAAAIGVRALAQRLLARAGPVGHAVATVIFGTIVLGAIAVSIHWMRMLQPA